MLEAVAKEVPIAILAGHCHDANGMAIGNIYASCRFGLDSFDRAVAGLGGYPYAKGATGNVATEDVVYILRGLGCDTGVDFDALLDVAAWINAVLGRASKN